MKFSIPHCPRCRRRLAVPWLQFDGTTCSKCGSDLVLKPGQFSLQIWLLFFSGALLVGSTVSGYLSWLAIPELSIPRMAVDAALAIPYFTVWRYVYFLRQEPFLAGRKP